MRECLVSVIVTVYNLEQYIEKCINSILTQSYASIQVIIVDDGSTDNSGAVCDSFACRDSRIRVIHKENGGLVSARKAGIQAAIGDFAITVDVDDWIEADYIEKLLLVQSRTQADIVAAGHCHDIGKSSTQITNSIPNGIYQRNEILLKALYSGKFFEYGIQPHICNKLFKRKLLSDMQMQVDERIAAGEDAAVVYPAILECDRICVCNLCGYHYVQHTGSMTKTSSADELLRLNVLIDYLSQTFRRKGAYEVMRPQLEQYKKYYLLLRKIDVLFETDAKPYGYIPDKSKVIIYGAGVSGQKLYQFLSTNPLLQVVDWVDQNDIYYREKGFAVNNPQVLKEMEQVYDYILIANIAETTASVIRKDLLKLGVQESQIRWLSKEFLDVNHKIEL